MTGQGRRTDGQTQAREIGWLYARLLTPSAQCFYHLELYEDALRLALGAGQYFDVNTKSEYVDTMIGECGGGAVCVCVFWGHMPFPVVMAFLVGDLAALPPPLQPSALTSTVSSVLPPPTPRPTSP